jgi:hypothetical protein
LVDPARCERASGARNAAKTIEPVESALLESRYKHLVLLIELKADSVFWYKYTIGGDKSRSKGAQFCMALA